jgi:hypothetical protein
VDHTEPTTLRLDGQPMVTDEVTSTHFLLTKVSAENVGRSRGQCKTRVRVAGGITSLKSVEPADRNSSELVRWSSLRIGMSASALIELRFWLRIAL